MFRDLLGRLLHLANSSPPFVGRREFYAMKDRVLRRYALPLWDEVQEIADECWGCDGKGRYADTGNTCRRCGGGGVYRTRRTLLQLWVLGRHQFHTVLGVAPAGRPATIAGRVRHRSYGMASTEALLLLALLFDRRLFLRQMGSTCHCGRTLYPLCLLQKAAWHAARFRERFRRRTCSCGRSWRPWFGDRNSCVCRTCRTNLRQLDDVLDLTDRDIPF